MLNENDREEFQGAPDMEAMEAAIAAAMANTEGPLGEAIEEETLEVMQEEALVKTVQEAPDVHVQEERELTLKDIVEVLTSMQTSIERMATLFAGMVDTVKEMSTGMTELSAAGLGGGKDSSGGPVNPVVLKLAVQAAVTAAIPELSKMLRGQIAAATVDLKQAAAEDARIVENNKKTVQEYTERRKNITQEV